MGIPGGWEWLLILAIVLIIFGAGKLPKVMGDVGKGVKNFKKGLNEAEEEEKPAEKKEIADQSTQEPEKAKDKEKA